MEHSNILYVIITPARNEEAYIERTIKSVVSQTILPKKWVIVSDGSTDRTDEIVSRYATKYDWIELIRMPEHRDRSFAAMAMCFNEGCEKVKNIEYDIIGKIDADISFSNDYFEILLKKFSKFPKLGLAGTPYVVDGTRDLSKSKFYDQKWVNGMCTLYRRKCLEDIGGHMPLVEVGTDHVLVIRARMNGWHTRTFTGTEFFHHRPAGTAGRNIYSARFYYGRKAFLIGNHPVWQLLRGFYQMTSKPYLLGGVLLIFGYFWAFIRGEKRVVSQEFVYFHRKEQMQRLKALIKRLWT